MKRVQERTGWSTTHQAAVAVGSLGFLYLGAKYWKSRIPTQKSTTKQLNVLIIGASRGIGLSLARQFLNYGDNVIIASSSESAIKKAYETLKDANSTIAFKKCDVTKPSDLSELYQFAYHTFNGKIDAVINNFGVSTKKRDYLWNSAPEDIWRIVDVNLKGMLLSNKYSITAFMEQNQSTAMHIFNMSGGGTYGMATPRFLTYGATKGGFLNILRSLNKELKMAKMDNIYVHSLSPGMVWTHLLANKENIENQVPVISDPKKGWIINALTEDATVVTEWMVPKIRGVVTMKRPRHSFEINFLIKSNAMARILGGMLFGYNKGRFVDENGMAVQPIK